MKKAIVVVILAALTGTQLLAQDQRVFNHFFMNPYVYNPAYAGAEGHTVFYGLYRMQYMGLEGAPTLANVSFHTPLKNNLAIGGLVYNEATGPLTTSGGKVTMGYILEVDKKHYVRFGMSVGGGYTGYDPNKIDIGRDPAFQNLESNSFLTADVGVTYHFDHFNVGFALPNLLSREVISDESFAPISLNPTDNMMFQANYRGHINDNFAIEPHLIYRFSTVNMPQYEITTLVHIMHMAWAGASYRQDAGLAAMVGFKIKDQFALGFAYEFGNSQLSDVTAGTAEIQLGYHLPEKKKHHNHSHSFLKSHKKSHEQRKREEARRERLAEQRREQALQRAAEAKAAKEAAAVAAATTAVVAKDTTKQEEKAVAATPTPVKEKVDESAPSQERRNADGTVEIGTTYVITNSDGSKSTEVRWEPVTAATEEEAMTAKDTGKPQMVNSNTAQKGHHFLELPVGHHVVAAQFKDFQQAEDYSDKLFERGFHGTIVGFVSAVGEYFVVVHKGATPEQAAEEQQKWQKLKDLDHVYIFNVVE